MFNKFIKNGGSLNIITSLSYPTNPVLLKRYLGNDSVKIRCYGKGFHPKVYLFERKGRVISAIIGSSNLTKAGSGPSRNPRK